MSKKPACIRCSILVEKAGVGILSWPLLKSPFSRSVDWVMVKGCMAVCFLVVHKAGVQLPPIKCNITLLSLEASTIE